MAWNTDKRYLDELAAARVPLVPTVFVRRGEPIGLPAAWRGGDVVVKPTVSASAADTGRFPATSDGARELIDSAGFR